MLARRATNPNGLARYWDDPDADEIVWYHLMHAQRRLCDTGGMLLTPKQKAIHDWCYALAKKSPMGFAFVYFDANDCGFLSDLPSDWEGSNVHSPNMQFTGFHSVVMSSPGIPRISGLPWWNRQIGARIAGGYVHEPKNGAPDPKVEFARKPAGREIHHEPQGQKDGDSFGMKVSAGGAKVTVSGGGVASKFTRG
jgi:hypothetical protein